MSNHPDDCQHRRDLPWEEPEQEILCSLANCFEVSDERTRNDPNPKCETCLFLEAIEKAPALQQARLEANASLNFCCQTTTQTQPLKEHILLLERYIVASYLATGYQPTEKEKNND